MAWLQGVFCAVMLGLTLLLPRMGLVGAGVAEVAGLAVVALVAAVRLVPVVRAAPEGAAPTGGGGR
ncbi:hypothetical protein ACFWMQ_10235 [Streptomyces sp. NPDC058372]|uniref:hypothetical protein n=1 Tax=Streptomyces sp. NPDC058372 TaxID=3346464 RepID=UPI00365CDCA3